MDLARRPAVVVMGVVEDDGLAAQHQQVAAVCAREDIGVENQ